MTITATMVECFHYLVREGHGFLSQTELDNAVVDGALPHKFAAPIAVLKALFDRVKALHQDSLFADDKSISMNDVLAFQRLLQDHAHEETVVDSEEAIVRTASTTQPWSPADIASTAKYIRQRMQALDIFTKSTSTSQPIEPWSPARIAANARLIMQRVQALIDYGPIPLYGSELAVDCIRPDAIRQGITGDCYFLAALASVVAANPNIVLKIIRPDANGAYTVTFPGLKDDPVEIEPPTIVELALYARLTERGSWAAVIEKAYGTYLRHVSFKPKIIAAENISHDEPMSELYRVLTGQSSKTYKMRDLTEPRLVGGLTKARHEKRAVTFGSSLGLTDSTYNGLATRHAYSLIEWNPSTHEAILRNPWGKLNKTHEAYKEAVTQRGGLFTLKLAQIFLNFDHVYVEEWSSDSRFSDANDGFADVDNVRPLE
jgi:Calpain family cysteine protease